MKRRAAALVASLGVGLLAGCDLAPVYDPPHFILPDSYQGSGPFGVAHPEEALVAARGLVDAVRRRAVESARGPTGACEPDPAGCRGRLRPGTQPGRRGAVSALSAGECERRSVGQQGIRASSLSQPQQHRADSGGLEPVGGGGIVGAGFLACATQQRARAEAPRAGQRRGPGDGAVESPGGVGERLYRRARTGRTTRGAAPVDRLVSGRRSRWRGCARAGKIASGLDLARALSQLDSAQAQETRDPAATRSDAACRGRADRCDAEHLLDRADRASSG